MPCECKKPSGYAKELTSPIPLKKSFWLSFSIKNAAHFGAPFVFGGAKATATEETKASPELNNLFIELPEPFDPTEIKWRVAHTSRDGNRGAAIAFADPRAYTDRLNQLFTPSGWTRTYEVATLSSVTRMKKGKLIQTGTCW